MTNFYYNIDKKLLRELKDITPNNFGGVPWDLLTVYITAFLCTQYRNIALVFKFEAELECHIEL
jgi:hypothetical protein